MSKAIKLIVYDFDGVLTDNRVLVLEDGTEGVFCNRSDGWWIKQIKKIGIEQIILSTEANIVVSARGRKIGLPVIQDVADKSSALNKLIDTRGLCVDEVVYVGNEMNDEECMKLAGVSMAPQDSHPNILKIATYVIKENGGMGIVRHVYEWIMNH